jgi:tetratricopeptide (TPR) repeat protein
MNTISDRMKGKKYFLDGNLPASIKAFTLALEKEPSSPEVLLGRGAAYLKLGRFDEAVQDLSKVLDGGGDCERAFFLRGIAYLNANELEQALADLNRALEYNRKRGAAILARGLALSSIGYHKEAKKDFNNSYVLNNILIDEFLEEYAISEGLFEQAMKIFSADTKEWGLLLTEDEMVKMEITHY